LHLALIRKKQVFIQRLLSAIILIPIVVGATYSGGLWFFAIIVLVASVAGYEFFQMMKLGGYKPSPFWGLLLIWLLLTDARYPGWQLARPALTGVIFLSLSWQLFKKDTTTPTVDWALTIVGGLYLGWMAGHFISLRDAPRGLEWMALMLLATWATDTGAYFIGLSLGRHKFFPRLSPKKTWEGTIGGWFCGVVVTLLVSLYIGLGFVHGLVLGALVCALLPLGDLAISMMKRQVGVKDTSGLIPGHGGMLDRIDSLLFAVVVVYYYACWAVGFTI
jgi:phosphatidate cytidylyltransferase